MCLALCFLELHILKCLSKTRFHSSQHHANQNPLSCCLIVPLEVPHETAESLSAPFECAFRLISLNFSPSARCEGAKNSGKKAQKKAHQTKPENSGARNLGKRERRHEPDNIFSAQCGDDPNASGAVNSVQRDKAFYAGHSSRCISGSSRKSRPGSTSVCSCSIARIE